MLSTIETPQQESRSEILGELEQLVDKYIVHTQNTRQDNNTIKLHESTISTDEIMAVLKCLMENRITMGEEVRSFEDKLESYFQISNAVTVNSGSSANLLAVSALTSTDLERHLKPGDEVIVPALSWSTSVWPIVQLGLVPVIVDIDPETLNIDIDQARSAISNKTKAIMPIHVYGNPCNMDGIMNLCDQYNLLLVEDCCEALGAKYNDQYVGSFGDVGTYSLYYSHHITTLEGGFTTTNDETLAEAMRIRRAHGWVRDTRNPEHWYSKYPDIDKRFLFVDQGYNFRISEPQGAMGKVQLSKLSQFVSQRRKAASQLINKLESQKHIKIQRETDKGFHSWFGMPITIDSQASFNTKQIRSHLENSGIETRPIICGNIAKQPAIEKYKHRVHGKLEHATNVMNNGFAIGSHQNIDAESIHKIVECIEKFA